MTAQSPPYLWLKKAFEELLFIPDYIAAFGEEACWLADVCAEILGEQAKIIVAEPVYEDTILTALVSGTDDGVVHVHKTNSNDIMSSLQEAKVKAVMNASRCYQKGFQALPAQLNGLTLLVASCEPNLSITELAMELIRLKNPSFLQVVTPCAEYRPLVAPGGLIDACLVCPQELQPHHR